MATVAAETEVVVALEAAITDEAGCFFKSFSLSTLVEDFFRRIIELGGEGRDKLQWEWKRVTSGMYTRDMLQEVIHNVGMKVGYHRLGRCQCIRWIGIWAVAGLVKYHI